MHKICIINKSKNKDNKNKINNKIKPKRKMIVVMSLLVILLNIPINISYANDFSDDFGRYHVYSYEYSNRYIKYRGIPQRIHEYYYLKDTKEYPAYCMQLGLNGAETIEGGYNVDATKYLDDKIANNIILNGYPYKTVSELGLANESEARYATQFALWGRINSLDLNQIVPMEDQYIRVINAIRNIYNNGVNSSLNYTNVVKVEEILNESYLYNQDKSCYFKEYSLEYGENILDITIDVGGVSDYVITDENNNKIDKIIGNKKIRILFPRATNTGDLDINLNVSSKYKESAVLFAKSTLNGMQDVSLTLEPIKTKDISLQTNIKEVKTNLVITKKDAKDSSINIPNVKFNIYDIENKLLGTFITDKNGKININIEEDLKIFKDSKIKIEEVEVPYPYILDKENSIKIIDINVGKEINVEFKNDKFQEKLKVELPKTGF